MALEKIKQVKTNPNLKRKKYVNQARYPNGRPKPRPILVREDVLIKVIKEVKNE